MVTLVAGVSECMRGVAKHKTALQTQPKMWILPVVGFGGFLRVARVAAPRRRFKRRLNFGELHVANVRTTGGVLIGCSVGVV